ncbi:hypothetical protein SAMN05421676_10288 [Salinibacillus kushneri]|uniref:Protein CcmA, bactofilin family n=1 Tax=Salinibacillus kushneri TaxID=237682 RepID=A0A1I0AAI3_9BACI|nr:hypothetical protein [Salinibacillus kushneri]SES91027.1 hypothetical protein SAMN05421676_10288 [Salinibacillus kushneri]
MTKEKDIRLKVLGNGSYPGGDYDKIKVTGQVEISGDVYSQHTKIIGECRVKGNATKEQVQVTGKLNVDEELNSHTIKGTGELNVKQSVKANTLDMRGFVHCSGNVELEKMDLKGGFTITGLLNVGDLLVNLQVAPSSVGEIGGEKIMIKSKSILKKSYTLEAEVIEGDSIYLEHTTAKIVRGNDVEIGPGCHIEKVEYRSTFTNKEKNSKNIFHVNQI